MSGGNIIDHIRALVFFDLTDLEQRRIAFHYTNLQPLWALDNVCKGRRSQPEGTENTSGLYLSQVRKKVGNTMVFGDVGRGGVSQIVYYCETWRSKRRRTG